MTLRHASPTLLAGTVAMAPLLLAQALHVRRVTPRLPEAAGEREGVQGQGTRLRLLILGDSAAAGVGASHQGEALAGQVVKLLSTRFELHWRLLAATGDRTADTRRRLAASAPWAPDIVLTSLGVNDVTGLRRASEFVAQQRALADELRARGARLLLLSGLPPVHLFPALPQPLRWALGAQARRFDARLAAWCATQSDCVHLPFGDLPDLAMMASDGFHPGPPVYAHWAGLASQAIETHWRPGH